MERLPTEEPHVEPAADDFGSVAVPDLVDRVEAQLTRAIVEGRLPPGARVVEAELARKMGVSRAPVREAARRLERQGVLVARPRHGFAVRTITVQEIDDLMEVRISLELTAVALTCRKASDAGLARLATQAEAMVRQAPTLPQHDRIATDLGFHTAISALSGNAHLHRIFGQTQTEMQMIIALIDAVYSDPEGVARSHLPVLTALLRRDEEAACAAMRLHLEDSWRQVRNLFAERHGRAPEPGPIVRPRLATGPGHRGARLP